MYGLTTSSKSGSYQHTITFQVIGDVVRIVERMHDRILGDWLSNTADRSVSRSEARAYYADRRRYGYRPIAVS